MPIDASEEPSREPVSERESIRRRLMFVPGEDFYFLAYTTLLLLTELKCTTEEGALVGSQKVAYLADLLGSDADLRLALTGVQLAPSARQRLALLYDRATARRAPLERIENALVHRGLLSSSRAVGEDDRIFLREPALAQRLLESDLFDGERQRLRSLRKVIPRVRTMTLATLKEQLFGRHGVQVWGD